MFILLASLAFCACSSSDDDGTGSSGEEVVVTEISSSEAPVWKMDWSNNQERPNWTEPSAIYENWTIMMVQLEETLQPFVSGDDLMAIFINDELRGLASPASVVGSEESSSKFILKAWGNETGSETVKMSLSYYSQKLKHLFTLSANIKLDSDETTGVDEAFIPTFTMGSSKYPVTKAVDVDPILSKIGVQPVSGNIIGAFVGEECRGTVTIPATGKTQLIVFGRSNGESVTLKYYDAANGKLYTITDAVKL
jgi:hypothetical protein